MSQVTVLGAGSWGTALAVLLAQNGNRVKLWGLINDGVLDLNTEKENKRFLPGIKLPDNLIATADLEEALSAGVEKIVFAVPSQAVRSVAKEAKKFIPNDALIINVAKGIEIDSLLRMSEVLKEEVGVKTQRISALSGPSHAEEVGNGIPTAVVAAAEKREVAEAVQDLFMATNFRVYTNPDLVGVEIGGTLKNVIALCAGIADGLGHGDNTKAALMTRGIVEIARLGVAMGASAATFAGLAGIGDLIVTCTSMHSRNRRAGIRIGQGIPLDKVLTEMGMVVEGVNATRSAMALSKRYSVTMPIAEEAYQVLFEGKAPQEAVINLMCRQKTHEM
ncbi:MAG: NAD(P)H-dependent glycerol-3-phosphate dehydrogenase, partial [Peptococcia bacterium]